MIKIENTEVIGWEHAIRGMRNPMNSWDKSDSNYTIVDVNEIEDSPYIYIDPDEDVSLVIGPNDQKLMKRLRNAGTDHRKFMRMIVVYLDITAPLYWWKEFDTYKVGTVTNSCSTMHKIHAKTFTWDDFSTDYLDDQDICATNDPQYKMGDYYMPEYTSCDIMALLIEALNYYRNEYRAVSDKLKNNTNLTEAERKHFESKKRRMWYNMIQLLPSTYNQKRTVEVNYEVLANMYTRKNHKLDEWHAFCDWIEQLPYSELITGKE